MACERSWVAPGNLCVISTDFGNEKMSTCDSLEFNNSEIDAIFVLSLNTITLEAPRILPLLGSRTLAQEMVHESLKK